MTDSQPISGTQKIGLSHGIEVQLQGHLNTTNDHDRRKNQILKDSPKVLFLVSVAQMLFSLHQFHTCGKFLTFS